MSKYGKFGVRNSEQHYKLIFSKDGYYVYEHKSSGRFYLVKNGFNVSSKDSSANDVTLDGDGTETINGELTWTLGAQYDSIEVVSNGTNWIIKTSKIASETDNWRYGLDTYF